MTLAVAQPGLDLLPVLGPQAPGHPQLATRRKTLQCVCGGGMQTQQFLFFFFYYSYVHTRDPAISALPPHLPSAVLLILNFHLEK
jgi:hypothetical protein